VVAAIVAIRVIRVLPHALEQSAIVFAATSGFSLAMLANAAHQSSPFVATLVAAALASTTGLTAFVIGCVNDRRPRPSVIALSRTSEHSVAVARPS
jgi:hypothetical protein